MKYEPGDTVGHWTLLTYLKSQTRPIPKNPRWFCRCVCGMEREVQSFHLQNAQSKSCGCQTAGVWKRAGLGRIVAG
jgi:hypothetical protein